MDKLAIKFVMEGLHLGNRVQNASSVLNARDLVVASHDWTTKFAIVIFDTSDEPYNDELTGAEGFKKSLRERGFTEQRPKLVLLKNQSIKLKRKRDKPTDYDYVLKKPLVKEDLVKMFELFKFNFEAQGEL